MNYPVMNPSQSATSHKKQPPATNCPHIQLRVKTDCMQNAGLQKGDLLLIDVQKKPVNGDWLILDFEGRLVIRQLQTGQASYFLLPFHQLTQAIEWPLHAMLPLVGIVKQIIRNVG